jgi:hypothetical protein
VCCWLLFLMQLIIITALVCTYICIYTNPHTRTQKVVFVVFYFVTKSKSRISSSSEDSETSESSE